MRYYLDKRLRYMYVDSNNHVSGQFRELIAILWHVEYI